MAKLHTEVHEQPPANQPDDTQHSPVVVSQLKKRADDWQLHLADQITSFAGSMPLVWVHVAIFAFWVATGLFGADPYPFQFLTFMVSLEAIFLSTFVMISQNRADEKRQVIANQQWQTVQEEELQNERLLRLSTEILDLTKEIHAWRATATTRSSPATAKDRAVR